MLKKIIFLFVVSFSIQSTAETSFGIIGDAGKVTEKAKQTRESMIRQRVLRTIIPGDNLYSNQTYDGAWGPWKNAGFSFDVVALGNHHDGYPNEMSFFRMPGEYYSKVIDGARYIVLNSDNKKNVPEQIAWFEAQIKAAKEKMIFLVYHHPTYTVSGFHSWGERKKFQEGMRPLIWKYRSKLTALILGHDHIASVIHADDLPMIISGAVMEVRGTDPRNYKDGKVLVKTAWHFDNKNAHWVKLSVDSVKQKAEVSFVRSKDDKVGCTAILLTGKPAQLTGNCVKKY